MDIPASAAPFFQEYEFSELNIREHAPLIIERVLAFGDRIEIRWLVDTLGWEVVRTWIAETGLYRLPWSRYSLWCIVFDLPRQERKKGIWKK